MAGMIPQPRTDGRRSIRYAVGIAVMFAATLIPVDASRLPEAADDLIGTLPAQAQSVGEIDGTAGACDTGWSAVEIQNDGSLAADPDGSLCALEMDACPEPPVVEDVVNPPRFDDDAFASMTFAESLTFPAFCDAVVDRNVDLTTFTYCGHLDGHPRLRALLSVEIVGDECRITVPARCPVSDSAGDSLRLNRADDDSCLEIERRTWTCPANGIALNDYRKCYVERSALSSSVPHPACDSNSPSIPIVSCRAYAGSDYLDNPTSELCSGYQYGFRGGMVSLSDYSASPGHWCTYDTAHLRLGCHEAGASCNRVPAHCMKRSVDGTGCDGVAATLRCRGLQAGFVSATTSLDLSDPSDVATATAAAAQVYEQGCVPCAVLPFADVPATCLLAELTTRPSASQGEFADVHRLRGDWYERDALGKRCAGLAPGEPDYISLNCRWTRRCGDPPRGQLAWESNHPRGIAVVGSTLTLRVESLPEQRARGYIFPDPVTIGGVAAARLLLRQINLLHYADGTIVRTPLQNREVLPPQLPNPVPELVSQGECVPVGHPRFLVRVEELWPDDDYSDISELFGPDSLTRWNGLSNDERRQITEAQGLVYIGTGGLAPASIQAADERLRRERILSEEIPCNVGADVWCPWAPRRAGYHRLTAVGAWQMRGYRGSGRGKRWRPPNTDRYSAGTSQIEAALQTVNAGNGTCDQSARATDYDCYLVHFGLDPDLLNPPSAQEIADLEAATGIDINSTTRRFDGLLGRPGPTNEWLYSSAADQNIYACPPTDLRATCDTAASDGYNYTESAPVGMAVYEVRVVGKSPRR